MNLKYDDKNPLPLECLSVHQLSHRDGVSPSVLKAVQCAFGPDGHGVILVSGLPYDFDMHRKNLLHASRVFAHLSEKDKAQFEMENVDYSTGWSCGREMFRGGVDFLKGSFYANPVEDDPSNGDEALRRKYPHYATPNIWPSESLVPNFESSFKTLGRYMNQVAIDLAWHCDKLVESVVKKDAVDEPIVQSLHDSLLNSRAAKGRLLHYFPPTLSESNTFWCGTHCDHSSLTGLCPASFVNENDGREVSAPPEAGLYVSFRGQMRKVPIPHTCVAFQVGETAQIMTGGILQATPHAVRMANNGKFSRSTFAVFFQPNPYHILKLPKHAKQLKDQDLVPPLTSRFRPNEECEFAEFARRTLKAYLA